MMLRKILLSAVCGAGMLAGCVKDDIDPLAPRPTGDYTEYSTGLTGLSGICLDASGNALYAVTDKGSICMLTFEGTVSETLYTSEHDFEAVTLDPVTGTVYLAEEGEMALYKLSGTTPVDIVKIATLSVPGGGIANKGLEGVAYGNGTIYAANQAEPTLIFCCSPDGNVKGTIDITFATFLSDICFDSSDNTLWILDSKKQSIFHCTLSGDLIATYSVDFVAKAEAMAIDRARNTIWIGCDQTSKLYRVDFDL